MLLIPRIRYAFMASNRAEQHCAEQIDFIPAKRERSKWEGASVKAKAQPLSDRSFHFIFTSTNLRRRLFPIMRKRKRTNKNQKEKDKCHKENFRREKTDNQNGFIEEKRNNYWMKRSSPVNEPINKSSECFHFRLLI